MPRAAPKRKTVAAAATQSPPKEVEEVIPPVKKKSRKAEQTVPPVPVAIPVAVPVAAHRKKTVWSDLQQSDYIPTEPHDIVLTCGDGSMGQLGHGEDKTESTKPRRIDSFPAGTKFLQVVAGGMHTVVLGTDHSVFTFGMNDDGALGRSVEDADSGMSFEPRPVKMPKGSGVVKMISAGDSHSAALTDTGAVVAWGTFRNKEKPMGLAAQAMSTEVKYPPRVICQPDVKRGLNPIVKIASGCHHILMLDSQGQILTVGAGECGQLGRIPGRENLRHSGDDSRLDPKVVVIPGIQFKDIWATAYGCVCQSFGKGGIYVFGQNNYLQLGVATKEPDAIRPKLSKKFTADKKWKKFAGEHHVLALDDTGKVWGIGRGDDHKLGQSDDSDHKDTLVPINIPTGASVVDVTASQATSAVATDSGVYVWGFNTNKELGLGADAEEVPIPTLVQSKHLEGHLVTQVSLGGQHMVMMAKKQED